MMGMMFEERLHRRELHFLDPDVARRYGVNAALVHGYLWRKARFGKCEAKVSMRELASRFPYMSKEQLLDAFRVLRMSRTVKVGEADPTKKSIDDDDKKYKFEVEVMI